MLTRLQKSMKDKDKGFTLIELLVVIVIIGILAAIAIPLFLNQRKKGVDASMKSDLKSAATILETKTTDGAWIVGTTDATVVSLAPEFKITAGNALVVKAGGGSAAGYCITATNPGGTGPAYYNSQTGGLTATAC